MSPTRRCQSSSYACVRRRSGRSTRRRDTSYRVNGIMDTPAEVKPIATSPSLRSHRKSTSKRYGRRRLRSRRDMVCRYTHSEPPSRRNRLPTRCPWLIRRLHAEVGRDIRQSLAAWMPSSRFGSRIAPNRSSGFKRDQRRILQQGEVDLRGFGTRHRVLRGESADACVTFQP